MERINDIIFLGAGASAAEGAPLQGELLKEYFRSCQDNGNAEMNERLTEFFKMFFGVNIKTDNLDSAHFPTFEEALGLLEIALNRGESFKNYGLATNNPRIQQIRNDLIFLIAIILDKKLRGTASHHKKLIRRIQSKNVLLRTEFVSLNYDILIDNALADLYPDFNLDYGVEFTNSNEQGNKRRPIRRKAVYLYKLHGSLNWLYCPACISLTLTLKQKRVATLPLKPEECRTCTSETIPIIIPPTFFKVMSNYYLQEIWHKTKDVLRQTKRIFFCGYCFPDADIHIKYLLKRAEINSGSTPEIFVINKNQSQSDDQSKAEEQRYLRFFKDKNKVHYTDISFETFCEHGL